MLSHDKPYNQILCLDFFHVTLEYSYIYILEMISNIMSLKDNFSLVDFKIQVGMEDKPCPTYIPSGFLSYPFPIHSDFIISNFSDNIHYLWFGEY